MIMPVSCDRQPLARVVRCRTVAKVLSIGLPVRMCFQCSGQGSHRTPATLCGPWRGRQRPYRIWPGSWRGTGRRPSLRRRALAPPMPKTTAQTAAPSTPPTRRPSRPSSPARPTSMRHSLLSRQPAPTTSASSPMRCTGRMWAMRVGLPAPWKICCTPTIAQANTKCADDH
jgi:hypothetical protein